MLINLFDRQVTLRDFYCSMNRLEPTNIINPYVNLGIYMGGCNANCPFCTSVIKGKRQEFDYDKLRYIMKELSAKLEVRKVSFTGGEPTLNNRELIKAHRVIKEHLPSSFYVLNTNGYGLVEMLCKNSNAFDSISLSRHHYDQRINDKIFGFETLTGEEIKGINKRSNNLHMSCNLVKGFIDSHEECCHYMDFTSSANVLDVGFVTLIERNDFCKEGRVEFPVDEDDKNIIRYKRWEYEDFCECRNYMYISKQSGQMVRFYSRWPKKPCSFQNTLSFDGQYLREGFAGSVIV